MTAGDESTEKILSEIISLGTNEDLSLSPARKGQSPGMKSLRDFAALLAIEPPEEDLQRFLTERPQFLMGLFGSQELTDLAFLCKPPVGTSYYADFAILGFGQGGCVITMIEIEDSSSALFTKKRTPARRLQGALGQVNDWRRFIRVNNTSFVRDMVSRAKKVPAYDGGSVDIGARFRDAEYIEDVWNGFGGYEEAYVDYAIVIGRWAALSREHQRLLIDFKRSNDGVVVVTYDRLARQALVRPDVYLF